MLIFFKFNFNLIFLIGESSLKDTSFCYSQKHKQDFRFETVLRNVCFITPIITQLQLTLGQNFSLRAVGK